LQLSLLWRCGPRSASFAEKVCLAERRRTDLGLKEIYLANDPPFLSAALFYLYKRRGMVFSGTLDGMARLMIRGADIFYVTRQGGAATLPGNVKS
jgi:hypothetical protein